MSIGIVGAGAIGLLLASTISKKMDVSLYVRRDNQKKAIDAHGIHILGQGDQREHLHIKDVSSPWEEDLIILAVKQPAILSLLKSRQKPHHKDQGLLFIQNGMAHLDVMENLTYENVFIGVIEHGVRKENDYTIDWLGKGRIRCGLVKGSRSLLKPFLSVPELHSECVENWLGILEDKLLVNAVINGLTSLYRVENGRIFENPYFKKLAYSLFLEVATALELPLESQGIKWDYIQDVGMKTALNRSSMLQDLEAGRQTEIDAILGYVLKRAKTLSVIQPLPLTTFVYESIKGMEILNH